jgi:hypothetical protein
LSPPNLIASPCFGTALQQPQSPKTYMLPSQTPRTDAGASRPPPLIFSQTTIRSTPSSPMHQAIWTRMEKGAGNRKRDRRVHLSPGMGRQRSRSAGENMRADSTRRASRFEPAYPSTGEDKEEEEEEQHSVRL